MFSCFSRAFRPLASFALPFFALSASNNHLRADGDSKESLTDTHIPQASSMFLKEDIASFNKFKEAIFKELPNVDCELDEHLLEDLANPPYSHHKFASNIYIYV